MAKGQAGYKVRTITCAGCGRTATGHLRPKQRYCSHACYATALKPDRRSGFEVQCAECRQAFYLQASRDESARFCSKACANTWQGRHKTTHTCKVCGGPFRWSPSRTASGRYRVTYCSLACRDADPERRARLIAMNTAQQMLHPTKPEALGYALLDSLGVAYTRQEVFAGKFTPDATVESARLVIQFDGDYWHDRAGTSQETRIQRRVRLDRSQDAYLRACGWRVLRLWASDLSSDPDGCAEKVRRHLDPPH